MTAPKKLLPYNVVCTSKLCSEENDCVLLIHWPNIEIPDDKLACILKNALCVDPTLAKEAVILPAQGVAGNKIILAPTGKVDYDYDDVRCIKDAAAKGVKRLLKACLKKPILYVMKHPSFPQAELVAILGVMEALHVSIQIRELKPENGPCIDQLSIFPACPGSNVGELIHTAVALEEGRRLARDIGEGDPERMSPPNVMEHVQRNFDGSCIKVDTIWDQTQIENDYPLFAAVNRGASVVERHRGNIIFLEYNPPEEVKETVMLVGKGVTYDTGGADIKAGGIMAGMSRDKCGAAAVAGFMQVVNNLQPKNVKVIAAMCMVRNSVGSNCYVADELIKARSGQLVRVGNTDAEGRMIMADVLCHMKEIAVNEVNPHIFTIATLTGHAYLTVGDGYSIVLANGPSKRDKFQWKLYECGETIGDPFEVSTVRREDLDFNDGKAAGDDIHQSNNLASSRTCRGHQIPAGFLLKASGLEHHGSGSDKPIKYCHLDIAGSAGDFPHPATGAPILALAQAFLL